jgi:hypothetical protein
LRKPFFLCKLQRMSAQIPITESIHTFDNLISEATHAQICQRLENSGWKFGHQSNLGQGRPFWKLILDGDAATDHLWREAKTDCEAIAGGELVVLRQYANGHTFGQGGEAHYDDHRAGSYTLLYYPMRQWQPEWAGETVFYNAEGGIAHRVAPQPRRAVMFDARLHHAGLAPSEAFTGLRQTIAFKLVLKSVFDAMPLPKFTLEGLVCNPFDAAAKQASLAALKTALLSALAASYTGEIGAEHLAQEIQRIHSAIRQAQPPVSSEAAASLTEQEIHDLAQHRLKSGMAIVECSKLLGFETGAPTTEPRTIEALLKAATVTTRLVSREELLAL